MIILIIFIHKNLNLYSLIIAIFGNFYSSFSKKTIPQIALNDDPYVYRLLFPTHLLKYFQKQDGKE